MNKNPFDEIESRLERIEKYLKEIIELKPDPSKNSDVILSRKDAAKLFGVSTVTLDRYVKLELIQPTERVGKPVRFFKSKVLESLEKLESNKQRRNK